MQIVFYVKLVHFLFFLMIQPAKINTMFNNNNYGLMSSKRMAQIIACNITFAFNNILQIHAEYQLSTDTGLCGKLVDIGGLCCYSTSQKNCDNTGL